jgi:hypothetical protein
MRCGRELLDVCPKPAGAGATGCVILAVSVPSARIRKMPRSMCCAPAVPAL